MKIIGLAYLGDKVQMYLKPDSALLVNKKPFFLPHFSEKIDARVCVVAKINRLGRHIAPKFASRYYSEIAPGLCFIDRDINNTTQLNELTCGIAFDNSMAVGTFLGDAETEWIWRIGEVEQRQAKLIEDLDNAVARVSDYITLRMGDMVAVEYACEPVSLERDMVITVMAGNEELLYCKIK